VAAGPQGADNQSIIVVPSRRMLQRYVPSKPGKAAAAPQPAAVLEAELYTDIIEVGLF
jgi:hypothetical protein